MAFHKCGHDGHMAILCGLAIELDRQSQNRKVILLFQPAEDGSGAQKCFQTQNLLHLTQTMFCLT
jgi:metal-dependent amidase/aminoacylase/carboxypeptidase family protein